MMMISPMFNEGVIIMNEGSSGSSTKSYRSSGRWKNVIDQVKPGDYVFIQFGHNDQKPDTPRHTEPRTSFRQNLADYINETKTKGGQPVLFTSIVRRKFNDAGKLEDTHGEYVTEVRKLAKELRIPLVDLNRKTADLVESMGPEKSKALFLYVEPRIYKLAPEGKKDDTHLNVYGATKIAGLAIEGLKETNLSLVKYIR
jgi:lysophospholipase L1-like esterase